MFSDIIGSVLPVGRITPNGVSLLGTCFLINKFGHLATAAHVINNNDNGLVIAIRNTKSLQDYQDTTSNSIQCIPVKLKEVNPFADACILKVDIAVQSRMALSSTDVLSVGEQVSLFGYPHADHGRMVLTQQNTIIGAKVLIDASGIKVKNVVLNIQSRPGQSGSPIINLKDMSIAGMIIGSYAPKSSGAISLGGIDPQTLHQTTHAISAEYLMEMI